MTVVKEACTDSYGETVAMAGVGQSKFLKRELAKGFFHFLSPFGYPCGEGSY